MCKSITWNDLITRRADLRDLLGHAARQFARLGVASKLTKARSTNAD
jgi:hypothetical protein